MPGVMAHEDVIVSKVSQLESGLPLENNDELVGNIINIEPVRDEDGHAALNPAEVSLCGLQWPIVVEVKGEL